MSKTIVLIYKLPTLYEILHEINDLLNFELQSALDELELSNIISDKKNFVVISETKISEVQGDNNIILSKFPIKVFNLIEKINIFLLKKKEIERLRAEIEAAGKTIVPLRLYFKEALIKCELAVGTGKNQRDKRQDLKKRVANREAEQALKKSMHR